MITREADAARIRAIGLFKHISDSHFESLLRVASVRSMRPQSVLFNEDSRPNMFYLLLDGLVELFSKHRDRRSTVAIIRSGQPCALTSIWQARYPYSARTLAPSQLLLIPTRRLHELMESDFGFATAAAAELAGEFHHTIEQLKSLTLRTSAERLACWLLRFDREEGGAGQFVLPCDKRTLASYLGMAPEHLSRNIATLAPAGLVVRGRRVALNNRSALEAMAGLSGDSRGGLPPAMQRR